MNANPESEDFPDLEASNDIPGSRLARRERASFSAWLLRLLLRALGEPAIEFELWTGERVAACAGPKVARVLVRDQSTLMGMLQDPFVSFGDAYSDGRIEIEGDLVKLLEAISRGNQGRESKPSLMHRLASWLHKPRRNTFTGSRDNIHHHYDIGNEFYAMWLGETMAYTCAYYPTADATLEQAQIAKMDHVCRKVMLKSGDSVVEAGCGWGSLAIHMASRYGANVRAFNISREQLKFARQRAQSLGLSDRVEFIEDDYRNITGRYDAFVSVGMLEHVGKEHYQQFGWVARNALKTDGLGLVHSIGRNTPAPLQPWIEQRIFPGAYPPALSEMTRIFEPWNLSILDVENIRLHYAATLRHWLSRYEVAAERIQTMFDRRFVRMWRLYLAGSIAGFESGTLQLFQVVFSPGQNNRIPMTRAHLYPSSGP
jgi:cyclopropane-fatty-acyl-phospholipid synthase